MGFDHDYLLTIHERHLDSFGHVNNSTYLDLFEEARWDFLEQRGYGWAEIRARKCGPVILEAHLLFKREVRNRERLRIQSSLESYEGRVGVMVQRMMDEGGILRCEARLVFGLFDLERRKLVEPTPEWRKVLNLPAPGV